MNYSIKQYQNLLNVKVSDFTGSVAILKYEGSQDQFFNKINNNDFVYFPIHRRTIKSSMVIDVEDVGSSEKSFDEFMFSLQEDHRREIKGYIKSYKNKFSKLPNLISIQNFLENYKKEKIKSQNTIKWAEKTEMENNRKPTKWESFNDTLKGNKYKIARIVTGNILGFSNNKRVLWKYIKINSAGKNNNSFTK